MTLRRDITVTQGVPFRERIPVLDDANTGVPVNGWTTEGVIRRRPGGAVVYTWPDDLLEPSHEWVLMRIPGTVSAGWAWQDAWYSVTISNPNSDPDDPDGARLVQGWVRLDRA